MSYIVYQPQYENSWALIVGINDYRHVSPLDYACNDADAVKSVLIDELGFPESQVIILKDEAATKESILESYIDLRNRAHNPDDRVLVFFAGHGETVPGLRGPVGYLVPVDGEPDKLNTLIRWTELTQHADLIPAKHIFYIIDACYSGLALQRAVTPGQKRFISELMQRLSRQVLTAGKADQTVADGGGPTGKNSIFTGYLIEGLRGAASDINGVLTANLLMNYVYRKVGQDSRSNQTPHYGHFDGDGDFVLRAPDDAHLKFTGAHDALVKSVEEKPEVLPATTAGAVRPMFADRNGYADPTSPNFGRNDWSERLGEARYEVGAATRTIGRAFSWLSFVVEPTSTQGVIINISQELESLRHKRSHGKQPHEQFVLPQNSMTTIDSVCFYGDCIAFRDYWGSYFRLDKKGNIEYADTNCVFMDYADDRRFAYVRLVGLTWQFMFFAQEVLTEAGYAGGVRFLVNLVGTRDTILEDFAKVPGKDGRRWEGPDDSSFPTALLKLKCPTPHLQLEYKFVVGVLNQESAREIIDDVAAQLGLAYNHQSPPRCFNYHTEEFPWKQYMDEVSYCRGFN